MDMKRNKLIGLLSLCLLAATFASCEDWNETEAVKQKVERPEDQNPELWAEYTAALRDYKQSEHFIVYARLFNSPNQVPVKRISCVACPTRSISCR